VYEARDGAARPFLVDLAHYASEWPWLAHAARTLQSDLADLGTTVETRVSTLCTDPWTGRVDASAHPLPEGHP
jgi:hypothetical protein